MSQSQAIVKADAVELALVEGDLSRLTPDQCVVYYRQTCNSLGLNPLTKPFEYLRLNGKKVLYATRNCTDQLRSQRQVSVSIISREIVDDLCVVKAGARTPDGRTDESIGAVTVQGLKGEAKANALMKAETKAKRRVTLSICGLSMVDESEVDSIDGAERLREAPQAQVRALPASKAAAVQDEILGGKKPASSPRNAAPEPEIDPESSAILAEVLAERMDDAQTVEELKAVGADVGKARLLEGDKTPLGARYTSNLKRINTAKSSPRATEREPGED